MAEPPKPKVTWAEAFMRIGLRMIDRGQALGFLLGVCLLLIFLKLDGGEIQGLLSNLAVLAWVLLPLVIVLWFFHVRFTDRITKAENRRLGEEKTFLQNQILDLKEQLKQLRSGDEP